MKTEPVNGTDHKCPRCGKPMREDWSHFDEYKLAMLYCEDCPCYGLGNDPKDAYAFLMRKEDNNDAQ